jgi:S1-C subfamily serine protease
MKRIVVLLLSAIMLSSCASILNPRYQKVALVTQRGNTVQIDGKEKSKVDGRYKVKRDGNSKQITISKEGYKDDSYVIMQNKRSFLYIFTIVPFAVLYYPPFFDNYPKAFNYPKSVPTPSREVKIAEKKETYKNIQLNEISVNVKAEDLKIKKQTYSQHLEKSDKFVEELIDENKGLKMKNTIFVDLLNESLAENGFIDTTHKVLKGAFLDNLLVNATIKEISYYSINTPKTTVGLQALIYSEMVIVWQVLDYYKQPIYTQEIKSVSGEFKNNKSDTMFGHIVKDAIEYSFIEFLSSDSVIKLLEDNSQSDIENSMVELAIPKSKKYVDNVGSAVKASLTIKTKKGHGSGFFISNSGHIVTNYHVVSDTAGLLAVLNNGKEYKIKVLRTSKIHDLALLKIEAENEFAFNLNNEIDYEIATDIYAIGTPSGEDLSQTLSKGIISGNRKLDAERSLIQTDASINGGNSGGVVIDKKANVVGVVSSKLKGYGIEGVAFCIPTKEVVKSLKLNVK